MAVTPPERNPDGSSGRIPKNRARVLIIATFVLMLVVVFGYLLIVGLNA